jgi:zinc protease
MKHLTRTVLPFLLASPAVALAADGTATEIEVIGTKPAQARPAKPNMDLKVPDFQLNSQVFDFPTGLRIIMQADRTHPVVSVLKVVDHGAGDDPAGRNGTAHFVEHTWFRSIHGDFPPIMTLIQDLGTDFNATTRPDTTDFRTVANSAYLPLLLRLESLRLIEPYKGMTEDQVAVEREVIRNEWRLRNEQSSNLVFDYLLSSIFPEGHPYHSRETNESLDAIDLKTLTDYFDKYYKPEKTTIIVVGDFDPTEARSLIFENFEPQLLHPKLEAKHIFKYPRPGITNPDKNNPAHWFTDAFDPEKPDQPFTLAPPPKPRVGKETLPLPPAPAKGEMKSYKAAVDNRTVLVGWSLPGGFRGRDLEMNVLAGIASNAIYSALAGGGYLDSDDKKRGLKDPGCFALPMKMHSVIACGVEITDTKRFPDSQRVGELMVDQLAPIWDPEQVTFRQQLFQRSKMEELARILRSVDDVAYHFGGRAEDIGFHAHQTGSPTFHSDRMNEVAKLDQAAVAQLGYDHLKRDRAAYVVIDPIPNSEIDKNASTSGYHGATQADGMVATTDKGADAKTVASAYVKPDLSDLVEKKLPNGMRIIILPNGESPLVEASLFTRDFPDLPKNLLGYAMNFSDNDWMDGWSPFGSVGNDPLQIAGERTFQGYSTANREGVRVPAGNLPGALWMLREAVESTRPDMNYSASYVDRRFKSVASGFHNRDWHVADLTRRHHYPESADRWPDTWQDVETMDTWSVDDVKRTLERHFQPANTTLLVVGNVDPDEALKQAVEYFAGWEPRPGVKPESAAAWTAPPMGSGTKVLLFDDPKRTQSEVVRTCRLNFNGVQDAASVSVLSSVLFDKVFTQLRVKEALAYSPYGSASPDADGRATVSFNSTALNTGVGRTVEYFQQLSADLEAGKIDDASLVPYKLRFARNFGIDAQSTSQMTDRLSWALRWNVPVSYLGRYGEDIAAVDGKKIQSLMQGCNGRSMTTVVGPLDVIEPQLKERGIAYEVVDWKKRGDELHQAADPKGFKKHQKDQAKAEKKKEAESPPAGDGSADSE